jgi:glutathione S-transferase
MIIVHHLNNSRSQRVLWMLEELDFPYEIRRYERDPKTMAAPPEMQLVHPLGKSPILQDLNGAAGDVTLAETGAICEYLAEKAGGRLGCPPDLGEALLYRQFLHYAEGSVMPVLFAMLVVSRVPLLGRMSATRIRPMLDIHLDYIEAELRRRPWFAGDELTAADIMMSFPLEAARARGLVNDQNKATVTWLEKIHARPAYKRAIEYGGAYAFGRH